MTRILSYLVLFFSFFNLNFVFAENHGELDSLLKTYVHDGWVEYKKLHRDWKNAEHPLKKYLKLIEKYSRKEVEGWNRNDEMAYYINAYNAYTIALILNHYPVKSIKEINKNALGIGPGPWKLPMVKLMGETHDLDWLEHEVLRPIFKDARVHAAINCASKGCPKLQSYAFVGDKLDFQLTQVMKEFVQDLQKNKFDTSSKKVHISKIFKWFEGDFKPSVREFLTNYVLEKDKMLLKNPALIIEYLEYDWDLNEK